MGLKDEVLRQLSNKLLRLSVPTERKETRRRPMRSISRVLFLGKFPNPTFDYYFAARLMATGMPPYVIIDIRNFDAGRVEAEGSFVIIVRYSSVSVSGWLKRHRDSLAGIAIFMDDDIGAAIISPEATLRYRYRLLRDCVLPLQMLNMIVDHVWVSTDTLAGRLRHANAVVVPPAPGDDVFRSSAGRELRSPAGAVSIAYHATAIHASEHTFLLPIMFQVLQARPLARFEVVATGKSAALWQSLGSERIVIKPPLPWQHYLRGQSKPIDIMLVPVTPSRLNDCRADTKRIDTVRVGAAAVLTDCPALRPAEEGEILLPYDQELWIRKIVELVDDPELRVTAAEASRRRVQRMVERAEQGIPDVAEKSLRET